MSRTKRIVLVLVILPVLAAILLRAVPIVFAVVWIFLWWGGVVRDNSPTPGQEWLQDGLYVAAMAMFAAAAIAGIRWVRDAPRT